MITLVLHLLRIFPFLLGGHRQLARLFWTGLARLWTGWREALVIVSPDTVLRWQRRRFRDYWTRLCGQSVGGRPRVNAEIATLVRKMAEANPLWGSSPASTRSS